jgi:AMMECR1 domain-containing protein
MNTTIDNFLLLQYSLCIILNIPFKTYYSSLFLKNTSEKNEKKCFGVFVTIFRNNNKKKVHGCIGYYNNVTTYNNSSFLLNNNEILLHIKTSAYNAAFSDNRSSQYTTLNKDPNAIVELSFMENIHAEQDFDEYSFNPFIHGIIVYDNKNNTTATFLPDVFEQHVSLNNIKIMLIDKLNSKQQYTTDHTTQYTYYYYTTSTIKTQIFSILLNTYAYTYNDTLYKHVVSFFNTYYTDENTPLYVDNNKNVSYDENDHVRNVSIDVQLYNNYKHYIHGKLKNILLSKIKKHFSNVFLSFDMLQYYSFLINDKSIQNNTIKKNLCTYMYNTIITQEKNIEPIFTYPEIILSLLNNCSCTIEYNIISELCEKCLESDNIFYLNWVIQVVVAYIKKYNTSVIFYDMFIERYNTIINNKINTNISNLETNELAVLFECGCALLSLSLNNNKHNSDNNENILLLKNHVFYLYIYLQQYRLYYNKKLNTGLYYFKNKTARLDITFHILNGLSYFHSIP